MVPKARPAPPWSLKVTEEAAVAAVHEYAFAFAVTRDVLDTKAEEWVLDSGATFCDLFCWRLLRCT